MRNRKLYLHMGSPKTGTSWLQSFLAINAEVLSDRGLHYPALEPLEAARAGEITSGNGARLARALLPLEHAIALKGASRDQAKDALTHYLRGPDDQAIISSEWLYILEPKALSDLSALLREEGWTGRPIIYFRRQDKMAQSVYGQEVMRNYLTKRPEDFCLEYAIADPRLDYNAMMDSISRVFGKENCCFRVYEPAQLFGGRLELDLLNCLECTDVSEIRFPSRKINVSLSRAELELVRVANAFRPLAGFNEMLRDQLLGAQRKAAGDGKLLIPLDTCRKIVAHFEDSNRAAARNFLGREDGCFFYEVLPEHDDLEDRNLSLEDLTHVLIGALSNLDRRLHVLEDSTGGQSQI